MKHDQPQASPEQTLPRPAPPAGAPVPKWAIHRRMYDWTLSFSHSKYSTAALAFISFIEAIVFPIPPFVLQIPMTLERRPRAWWYATVTTAASVAGGGVGYVLGHTFEGLAPAVFSERVLEQIHGKFSNNVWLLTGAAIAIHPFKLFTIAAGFFKAPFGAFLFASLIGRGLIFYGIAMLLWIFGPPVRVFIDKYFNLLTIVFGLLVIGAVVALKLL